MLLPYDRAVFYDEYRKRKSKVTCWLYIAGKRETKIRFDCMSNLYVVGGTSFTTLRKATEYAEKGVTNG